mmetsp:Transcript_8834/g.7894  ORF Transcript_8834/g.7894 Transcript_8834/m.7894 type:complete len:249 (-) Transcript_8834:60-806(-)
MNKIFHLLLILSLLLIVKSFTTIYTNQLINKVVNSKFAMNQRLYMSDEVNKETEEEAKARILKKARKNLYSENGVAFAPWVTKQVDLDAIVDEIYRKEQQKDSKKKTSVLDRGEIETSEGMKWRMKNDLVELAWVTNEETENKGFIVEKRPSYGGDFQEIASFKEVNQLVSRGVNGGRYQYTDPSTGSGSWIYRIKDCDSSSNKNVICQCFVEVQNAAESKFQALAAVGIVIIFAGFFAVGYALDPQQ